MIGVGRLLLPEILCQTDRVGAKSPIFTALHGMQRGLNDEISVCLSVRLSVRLSVCLSVKRVHCDKTEEKSVRIFIPCERPLCLLL